MSLAQAVEGAAWRLVLRMGSRAEEVEATIPSSSVQRRPLGAQFLHEWFSEQHLWCPDLETRISVDRPGELLASNLTIPASPCTRWLVPLVVAALAWPTAALAQRQREGQTGLGIDARTTNEGPPPPVPPAVISRDASGRVTMRAVRVSEAVRIDGRLEERVYQQVPPMSDFVQTEPTEGAPASEKTEVWVLFDAENVYLVARCWESEPERMMFSEMRRDNINVGLNDNLAWAFDTFYDRRTGYFFEVNPIGGRQDGQSTNEGRTNFDWNPVWDLAIGRFDGGWTVEAAFPFKSLRYRPGPGQVWGFNVRRTHVGKNEFSYVSPIPAAVGRLGLRPAVMAPLVGLEAPPGSRNLEVKPYAVAELTTDQAASPRISNDAAGELGLDVKYGITQNLTADFTYNTDFAQVEADELQVNLTRFSLFFPEKREFFLENRRTFDFGGGGGDTPILFYSRRIGVQDNRVVPIQAGGRMTGRVGGFDLGLLHIRTGDEEVSDARSTGFTAVRLKRDVLRQSSVGLLVTQRSKALSGPGSNSTYGADGTFFFFENRLLIESYWARTRSEGVSGDESSYRGYLDYNGDRYGVTVEQLAVGDAFNPEVGFVRRDDMRKSAARFRFSPRLPLVAAIRKLSWSGSFDYIEDIAGRLETRETDADFGIEFESGDRFRFTCTQAYEFLPEPFEITPDIMLPIGGYTFDAVQAQMSFGQQRSVSGSILVEHGEFFSGEKTGITVSRGRLALTPQFAIEPSYGVNWVDLAEGAFTTSLTNTRVIYAITPKMFATALLQYDSASNTVAVNARLRWEYQPGSELFVVYNEQRDTMRRGYPALENRALVVKINRLFRF